MRASEKWANPLDIMSMTNQDKESSALGPALEPGTRGMLFHSATIR